MVAVDYLEGFFVEDIGEIDLIKTTMRHRSNDDYLEDIVGYCSYCHDEIYVGDDYIVEKGAIYHKECFDQSKCYVDPSFLEEED